MIIDILKKFFLEFRRNKISVGLVFVFPLFFLFIFNMAFGANVINTGSSYNIAVINMDQGIPSDIAYPQLPQNWVDDGVGDNLTQIIFDVVYKGNDSESVPIFEQQMISQSEIESSILDGNLTLVLIIPEDFSLSVLNMINNAADLIIPGWPTNVNETFTIYGDERSQSFSMANSIIQSIINSFIESVAKGDNFATGDIRLVQNIVLPEGDINIFDIIAPGIFVFATILSASYFAAMIINDEEQGMMNRIKLSLINPKAYVGAFMILAMAIMMLQALLLFAASHWILGFQPIGSFFSGFLVMALLAMATFGLIFTVGSMVKSSDTAGSALGMSSSIIGFASGSFMQMPNVVLIKDVFSFTSGSADFLLWDVIPWTHANNALRAILLYDQSLGDVAGDLLLLVVMGLVWMLLGMRLFTKRRFAIED